MTDTRQSGWRLPVDLLRELRQLACDMDVSSTVAAQVVIERGLCVMQASGEYTPRFLPSHAETRTEPDA